MTFFEKIAEKSVTNMENKFHSKKTGINYHLKPKIK